MKPRCGFTLVELLVALSITLIIAAGIFAVTVPARAAVFRQPAILDIEQRLRAASETIGADLQSAGSGPINGLFGSSLGGAVAAVLPYRIGPRGDPPGTVRPDAITLISAAGPGPATPLRDAFVPGGGWAQIALAPACPSGDPSCGLRAGAVVLLASGRGHADLFRVLEVSGASMRLEPRGPTSGVSFPAGSMVVPVTVESYQLKAGTAADGWQLVHGDGDRSDLPQIDHVVQLAFEYFGDPSPPQLRPAAGPADPPATYGPAPPPAGVDDSGGGWPAGENCTFQLEGNAHVSRLQVLGNDAGLVRLPPSSLNDGPWCPDAAAPNRYDADLLRLRAVRVTLRVEAWLARLRGADTRLFTNPGSSRTGLAFVPDRQVVFDVVPRCLAAGR